MNHYQEINANRFETEGIKKIIESYGKTDELFLNGTLEDIRRSLDKDAPVIVHGYSTKPGHLFVIKGYDRDNSQFIVHDPYGEPHFGIYPWRYDLNRPGQMRGKNLRYSYKAVAACCSSWSLAEAQNYYFSDNFEPERAEAMWLHSVQP